MKCNKLLYIGVLVFWCHLALGQKASTWKQLFNGQSLNGWHIVGSNGNVFINEGTIECHMTAGTPMHTFIVSDKKYKNFILELDCKRDVAFNTGILFRTIKTADTASVSLYGYQVKIDPSETRKWTGGVFDDFGSTWKWMYDLSNDRRARESNKGGEWNHFRIEAIDDLIRVWVNGVPTANLRNTKYVKAGWIAFKIHSLGKFPKEELLKAQFKNIKIISRRPERFKVSIDIPEVLVE